MTWIIAATLAAEIFLGGSLILTLVQPRYRIWPPPDRNSWQFAFTWGLTLVSFAGTFFLGILDWNSFIFDHWLRLPVGSALLAASLILVLWAIRTLGVHASQGLGGGLVRDGPYQLTRNPQYVADIVMLAGFAVLTNSVLAFITGALGAVWFVLAPFTEEPWLREQFGEEYAEYSRKVPRFISLKKPSRI